jgi:hypothetical protein
VVNLYGIYNGLVILYSFVQNNIYILSLFYLGLFIAGASSFEVENLLLVLWFRTCMRTSVG